AREQASDKAEVGGGAVHLADAPAVRAAAERMAARLRAHDPHATIAGFLVQEMVDGLEMLIGAREDPQFGPVMAVGFGGVAVEAIKDVSIRLLPIDHGTAADMIFSLRGAELLGTFPGRADRHTPPLPRALLR